MIIVTDVDGVLNNLMSVVLDIYNNQYKTSFILDDIKTYNLENCFDPEVAKRMKDIFNSPTIWKKVKPVAGAQECLEKLINKGHQVYLVTDNCPDTYGEKVKWIKRFFPFVEASKIVCMKDKWLLRTDIMIEDCFQTLIAKPHYHRILIDHPWNREARDYAYDIHRCSNWNGVVNIVNKIDERESDMK
jgi:5'(3')-deoxyribonucleotidase